MYRLARPRSTEYCWRTSAPRSKSSTALSNAASTSGVNPLVAISARAEARPQADLLADPVRRRRHRREDGEHVRGEADRVEVPAVGVVEDQERTRELVEPLEIARGHPVGPRDPQVRDVDAQRSASAVSRSSPVRSAREPARPGRRSGWHAPGEPARRLRVAGRAGRRRTPGSSRASRREARRPAGRPCGRGSSRPGRRARRGRRAPRRRARRDRPPRSRPRRSSASANTASSSNRRCSPGSSSS